MPRAKDNVKITDFPWRVFSGLFARVAKTRREFLVPMPGPQPGRSSPHAFSMRSQLYAFRVACQEDPKTAANLGISIVEQGQVKLRVTEAGLLLFHVDEEASTQAAVAALAAIGIRGETLTTPGDEGTPKVAPHVPLADQDLAAAANKLFARHGGGDAGKKEE